MPGQTGETTVHQWRSDRGELRLWYPAPSVVATHVVGHFDVTLQTHFLTRANARIASGLKIVVFHNWEEMTGYESRVRQDFTSWAQANKDQIEAIHILVRAKIVSMGVAVASVSLGGLIQSYTDRIAFGRLLSTAANDSGVRVIGPDRS
jgi:hypothetical protein